LVNVGRSSKTDRFSAVKVIGGGVADVFAALMAKEKGLT
jgi:hypothetical protein